MKKFCVVCVVLLFSGCQTMFAHYRLYDHAVVKYAGANVFVNSCVAHGYFSPNEVREYNYYVALILDFAVFDERLFEREYQKMQEEIQSFSNYRLKGECNAARDSIRAEIPRVRDSYYEARESNALARREELAQFGRTMSDVGNSFSQAAASINDSARYIPPVKFEVTPQNDVDHYLINTRSGFVQCKKTAKGYVFCL